MYYTYLQQIIFNMLTECKRFITAYLEYKFIFAFTLHIHTKYNTIYAWLWVLTNRNKDITVKSDAANGSNIIGGQLPKYYIYIVKTFHLLKFVDSDPF